jgi:hypothetical protein
MYYAESALLAIRARRLYRVRKAARQAPDHHVALHWIRGFTFINRGYHRDPAN